MSTAFRIVGRRRLNWRVLAAICAENPSMRVIAQVGHDSLTRVTIPGDRMWYVRCKERAMVDPGISLAIFNGSTGSVWLYPTPSGNVTAFEVFGQLVNEYQPILDAIEAQGIDFISEHDEGYFRR